MTYQPRESYQNLINEVDQLVAVGVERVPEDDRIRERNLAVKFPIEGVESRITIGRQLRLDLGGTGLAGLTGRNIKTLSVVRRELDLPDYIHGMGTLDLYDRSAYMERYSLSVPLLSSYREESTVGMSASDFYKSPERNTVIVNNAPLPEEFKHPRPDAHIHSNLTEEGEIALAGVVRQVTETIR